MKLCIIGNGLTSLTLANYLVNNRIYVDILTNKKKLKTNKSRTIGISKSNLEFFNNYIINIKKLTWSINKIEIFSENLLNEKIINFENEKKLLFVIIKNDELQKKLFSRLVNSKFCKFKLKNSFNNLLLKSYDLIINCDESNEISRKYFSKKTKKKYNSFAYTSIIKHKKISNNTALQNFTQKGPIAFLPISPTETSIVYSIKGKKKETNLKNLIKKYNQKYDIIKLGKVSCFELKASNLRSYYHKNILAFGDLLHRLHPLAGQGFNMSLRDIKELTRLIKFKLDHGLEINNSICIEFEKKTKHRNYLFSSGVDFIYELFNFESRAQNKTFSKSIKFFARNKFFNKSFQKIANEGLEI